MRHCLSAWKWHTKLSAIAVMTWTLRRWAADDYSPMGGTWMQRSCGLANGKCYSIARAAPVEEWWLVKAGGCECGV